MKNYTISKNSKSNKKRWSIFLICFVFLIIGVVTALEYTGVINIRKETVKKPPESTIIYNPPTEEEQKAGDAKKEEIVEHNKVENNAENKTEKTNNTEVIITDAGQYDNIVEVRAFVPNHYEDGSCKITLTKGSLKVEKETTAYRDVSTTICTNPLIARSEFASSGDWEVVVSYTAHGASGTSNAKVVHLR